VGRQPDAVYNLNGYSKADGIFGIFNALGTVAFAYGGHNVILEIQVGFCLCIITAYQNSCTVMCGRWLCRGADPTARSAVGWTASDFCGSHESQHGEINRLLGEAQMLWQQDRDKQHSQQMLPHQDSNKENNDSQLQIELPGYSTPSPRVPTATQHMFRSYSSQDEPSQYRVEEPAHFGMPQQQHYQLQPQQQQQQLFQHPLLNPMLSQGMLAQATMARLSQAGSEPANSSLSSSMLSLRSSELSNGSNLSRELGLLPAGLHSPMGHHQQNPATLSKPVCRYWHSGRCLYGAHCRYSPALPVKTQGMHCSA